MGSLPRKAKASVSPHPEAAGSHDPFPDTGSKLKRDQERRVLPWGWLAGAALIVLAILAYLPVWKAGYIWDDPEFLTENKCIVGPKGLWEIWTTREARICPLTLTSFWFMHALWGLRPLGYHVVTVLLHGGCAVVLWHILRQLRVPGAWLGAALWELHPVQAESVAWVTEMRNTQSGLFFLLAISAFLRILRPPTASLSPTPPSPFSQQLAAGLVLLYSALAMASKSSTVVLPLVLVLCAWWVEGCWNWRHTKLIAGVLLLAAAASVVSIWTQSGEPRLDLVPHWSLAQRLLYAASAVVFYLGKLVWPHPLISVYPRAPIDPAQVGSWLPLLGLILAAVLLVRWRNGAARPALFSFLYFLVALLPVLGLVNHTFLYYSTAADRFQYLASIGPIALVGAGLATLPKFWPNIRPVFLQTACAAILCVLAALTWQQSSYYQSSEKLWGHALAENPQCWAAHNVFAYEKQESGNIPGAITEWQRALEFFPDDFQAHINLGILLQQVGHGAEALEHARRAAALCPRYASVHNNLANGLRLTGQIPEAVAEYEKATDLDLEGVAAACNLAWILATCPDARLRDPVRAIAYAERANHLSSTPDPRLLRPLAASYAAAGRYADADQTAGQALALANGPKVSGLRTALERDRACYRNSMPVIDAALAPRTTATDLPPIQITKKAQ